jgi:hypothetical protein
LGKFIKFFTQFSHFFKLCGMTSPSSRRHKIQPRFQPANQRALSCDVRDGNRHPTSIFLANLGETIYIMMQRYLFGRPICYKIIFWIDSTNNVGPSFASHSSSFLSIGCYSLGTIFIWFGLPRHPCVRMEFFGSIIYWDKITMFLQFFN